MEEVTLSDKLSFFCITSANVKMASIGKTLLLVWHFFLKWGSPSSASKRRIQLLFKLIQRGSIKIRYHKTRSHHLIPRNPIMGEITYCQRLYPKNRNKRPTNWIPGASLSHPIAKAEAHNRFSRPLATTLSLQKPSPSSNWWSIFRAEIRIALSSSIDKAAGRLVVRRTCQKSMTPRSTCHPGMTWHLVLQSLSTGVSPQTILPREKSTPQCRHRPV
jgi:hypothetical protein